MHREEAINKIIRSLIDSFIVVQKMHSSEDDCALVLLRIKIPSCTGKLCT